MDKITPHVSYSEQIITAPQVTDNGGSVIMMALVSDFGPIEPKIVTKRQLVELYTNGKFKKSDNITLKTASILSDTTNLLVCRAESEVKENMRSAFDLRRGKSYLYNVEDGSIEEVFYLRSNNQILPCGVWSAEGDKKATYQKNFPFNSLIDSNCFDASVKTPITKISTTLQQMIGGKLQTVKIVGVQKGSGVEGTVDASTVVSGEPHLELVVGNVDDKAHLVAKNITIDEKVCDAFSVRIEFTLENGSKKSRRIAFVSQDVYNLNGFVSRQGEVLFSADESWSEPVSITSKDDGTISLNNTDIDGLALLVYKNILDSKSIQNVKVQVPKTGVTGEVRIVDNQQTYDLTLSLDPDAVDGFGTHLYIKDQLELNGLDFDYVQIGTPTKFKECPMSSLSAVGNYARSRESIVEAIKVAYGKMAKYRRDLQVKFCFDGGIAYTEIIPDLEALAKKRRSLGVFSAPTSIKTWKQMSSWVNSLDSFRQTNMTASSYLYTCVPALKDNGTFGWYEEIPYTVYYMLATYGNASGNLEFIGAFHKDYGRVKGSKHTMEIEYSNDPEELALDDDHCPQAEWLQRKSVNPIIYDNTLGYSFLVNNLTFQTPNLNELSEENNRRLFNKLQFEINAILDNYIGKKNNASTREMLDNELKQYKMNRIDTLGASLNDLVWDIKPYNPAKRNNLDITVDVKFENSIKYVTVLYRSLPMTE